MTYTIDIFCDSGSPIGVHPGMIDARGVGGAELALMSLAQALGMRGHVVTVYNDPEVVGAHDAAMYLPKGAFRPKQERDVFIAFRGGNPFLGARLAPAQIFWSCDQHTYGNYDTDVFPWVDWTVTISPYHLSYFLQKYSKAPVDRMDYIDIGVRTWEYTPPVPKKPRHAIYCSVPDRGLPQMAQLWPQVVQAFPDAVLTITSDYRLWGVGYAGDEKHRAALMPQKGVRYLGKVSRHELVQEQLEADVMFYPCEYDELFCIAAAECQVAGAYPITTDMGALATTNFTGRLHNVGCWDLLLQDLLSFWSLPDEERSALSLACTSKAVQRFDHATVCAQWEALFKRLLS